MGENRISMVYLMLYGGEVDPWVAHLLREEMNKVGSKTMRYRQAESGDKRQVPFEGMRLVACCGCGLVHRYDYNVEDGKIFETVYEANRETAQQRRRLVKRGEIVANKDGNVYVIFQKIHAKRKSHRFTAVYEPC